MAKFLKVSKVEEGDIALLTDCNGGDMSWQKVLEVKRSLKPCNFTLVTNSGEFLYNCKARVGVK